MDNKIKKIMARTAEPLISNMKAWQAEKLKRNIGSRIWFKRKVATVLLGYMGGQDAVQPLTEALKDKDESVRRSAAKALGYIGNPEAVQPLIEALKDKDAFVRREAVISLGSIGSPSAFQQLILTLNDEYRDIRLSVVQALGKTGCSDAVKPLANILKNDITDDDMRTFAVEALGNIDDQEALQSLIEALKDINPSVRGKAAEALGKTGDSIAVQPLIEALKDTNSSVRRKAAEALGKTGDSIAVQPLIENYKTTDFSRVFVEAIGKIIYSDAEHIDSIQKSYPHLICGKCFLKAKNINVKFCAEGYPPAEHAFIGCRHCNTWIHLIQNIRQVIGLIGGDIQDYHIDEDKIYISLWSEQQKKAGNADIDVLEIREGKDISYDYAINAVLVTLKND
ncbi:MAG: HEAT repeat domain-containing protein, partial [Desulfobacterales bacterium]|nr:HEAT repeat domain-containing protein [Desulfobacterales bacterium]